VSGTRPPPRNSRDTLRRPPAIRRWQRAITTGIRRLRPHRAPPRPRPQVLLIHRLLVPRRARLNLLVVRILPRVPKGQPPPQTLAGVQPHRRPSHARLNALRHLPQPCTRPLMQRCPRHLIRRSHTPSQARQSTPLCIRPRHLTRPLRPTRLLPRLMRQSPRRRNDPPRRNPRRWPDPAPTELPQSV
jgi:hypothetical protein